MSQRWKHKAEKRKKKKGCDICGELEQFHLFGLCYRKLIGKAGKVKTRPGPTTWENSDGHTLWWALVCRCGEPVKGCGRKKPEVMGSNPLRLFASFTSLTAEAAGKVMASIPHQCPQVNVTVSTKGNVSGNWKTTAVGPYGWGHSVWVTNASL